MADGTALFSDTSEPDIWAERQKYWESVSRKSEPKRLKRSRRNHSLILSGHNISMRIHHGALLIKDGFGKEQKEKLVLQIKNGMS